MPNNPTAEMLTAGAAWLRCRLITLGEVGVDQGQTCYIDLAANLLNIDALGVGERRADGSR